MYRKAEPPWLPYCYGMGTALTAAGFAVGALVYLWLTRRDGVGTEGTRYILLAGLCGGVFGARLTEWLCDGAIFTHPEAFLSLGNGGRTLVGGILCGWLAVEWTKRRLGIRRSTGDYFALALAAGESVGRLGCFVNGCCYGTPTSVSWAVYQHDAWRHPSQLYMAGSALLIFLGLLWYRRQQPATGQVFRLWLVLFGASRFVLEGFRDRPILFAGLSLAQIVCLEMALLGLVLLRRGGGGVRVGR